METRMSNADLCKLYMQLINDRADAIERKASDSVMEELISDEAVYGSQIKRAMMEIYGYELDDEGMRYYPMDKEDAMDIEYNDDFFGSQLSPRCSCEFVLDGVLCCSMESFLQAIKHRNPKKQKEICLMSGAEAQAHSNNRWRITHTVYWDGVKYNVFNDSFKRLIDRAFIALYEQSSEYRDAIQNSKYAAHLIYTTGQTDSRKELLTTYELLRRIEWLRKREYC